MSSASTAAIRSAGRRLIDGPPVPILLAWPREDMLFPLAHAERYAQALDAVTAADVARAAERYLTRPTIVVLQPTRG